MKLSPGGKARPAKHPSLQKPTFFQVCLVYKWLCGGSQDRSAVLQGTLDQGLISTCGQDHPKSPCKWLCGGSANGCSTPGHIGPRILLFACVAMSYLKSYKRSTIDQLIRNKLVHGFDFEVVPIRLISLHQPCAKTRPESYPQ